MKKLICYFWGHQFSDWRPNIELKKEREESSMALWESARDAGIMMYNSFPNGDPKMRNCNRCGFLDKKG